MNEAEKLKQEVQEAIDRLCQIYPGIEAFPEFPGEPLTVADSARRLIEHIRRSDAALKDLRERAEIERRALNRMGEDFMACIREKDAALARLASCEKATRNLVDEAERIFYAAQEDGRNLVHLWNAIEQAKTAAQSPKDGPEPKPCACPCGKDCPRCGFTEPPSCLRVDCHPSKPCPSCQPAPSLAGKECGRKIFTPSSYWYCPRRLGHDGPCGLKTETDSTPPPVAESKEMPCDECGGDGRAQIRDTGVIGRCPSCQPAADKEGK